VSSEGWLAEQLRRYTTGMTTSPLYLLPRNPPSLSVALPTALTEVDADRSAAAISAARTESTRRIYAYTWGQWARWCASRGLAPMPGDPAALCAYLTERAEAGIAMGSLDLACTAIRHVHRMHEVPDPVASETVRQVRLGLRRGYGTAPRQLARPLSTEDIRQILTHIDRSAPSGIRDAAIILLGYASAMRRSEIIGLDLLDIREEPGGILVTIRRSKTDQEGHGQTVAVARGMHPTTDPVDPLAAWRKVRGHQPGPLFTRFYRSQISLHALAGDSIARILRKRACEAGLDGTRITAHSLRAGHATTAALGGVPLARIAAQTRHKDLAVLVNRYIRPLEALATTSSRDLGL
jgi:integrase